MTVAGCRLDLLGQFGDHVTVDEWVHVAAQHVEDPPVADISLASDSLCHFLRYHLVPGSQEHRSDGRAGDDDRTVDDQHGQHRQQDDEPEPDEDVGLLVDDVERQDAQRVVLLDGA